MNIQLAVRNAVLDYLDIEIPKVKKLTKKLSKMSSKEKDYQKLSREWMTKQAQLDGLFNFLKSATVRNLPIA